MINLESHMVLSMVASNQRFFIMAKYNHEWIRFHQKTRLLLVALVTGPLKQRFLEENFGPANS